MKNRFNHIKKGAPPCTSPVGGAEERLRGGNSRWDCHFEPGGCDVYDSLGCERRHRLFTLRRLRCETGGDSKRLLPSLAKTSGDGVNADYSLTILNSGNGTDKFTLTYISSHGWQILLVRRYQRKRYFGCCRLQCGCHCINRFSQSRFKFQDYCPRGCSKQ